ncbi:DNA-directed RNA polymerase subunit omega [Thermodesulfobacteriota bacterium]
MARITVEDCLEKVNNRFTLIHMASKRVRELRKGDEPTITSKNRDVVVALREIAAGNIVKAEPGSLNGLSDALLDILPENNEEITETVENEGAETEGKQ